MKYFSSVLLLGCFLGIFSYDCAMNKAVSSDSRIQLMSFDAEGFNEIEQLFNAAVAKGLMIKVNSGQGFTSDLNNGALKIFQSGKKIIDEQGIKVLLQDEHIATTMRELFNNISKHPDYINAKKKIDDINQAKKIKYSILELEKRKLVLFESYAAENDLQKADEISKTLTKINSELFELEVKKSQLDSLYQVNERNEWKRFRGVATRILKKELKDKSNLLFPDHAAPGHFDTFILSNKHLDPFNVVDWRNLIVSRLLPLYFRQMQRDDDCKCEPLPAY